MKNNTNSSPLNPALKKDLNLTLINAVENPRGESPYEDGLTEMVAGLLARGADVDARASDDATALMLAAKNGHTEIIAKLLDQGADVNAVIRPDGGTALMFAALNGHTEIVAQLLDRGADFNAERTDGVTALMYAALNGHTETVALLLDRGADFNVAIRPDCYTALMIAAGNGHTEIVAQLLNKGADVNAESDGYTALMLAAKRGHTETVLALLPRNDADWQIVQDQLRHPALRNLNKEVSVVLAITLPEGELRNLIITSFNQRNPNNQINQENNNILGAGIEAYKTLKDLKSWHVRYLADSGCPENEVRNLADQRFFDLLNHQDARQGALARNDLVMDLVSKSGSLAIDSVFGDEEALVPVRGLNPEDFYKLTTKIIDKSRDEHGIPRLEALSLVAALRKDRKDQTSASPAPTMYHGSVAPIVNPQKGGCCVVS